MPTERLSMRKIKDIMRLKHEQRCTHKEISESLNISSSTVSSYLNRAKAVGLTWPIPDELDEDAIYAKLFPPAPSNRKLERPKPDVQWIHKELKRKGVTLCLLWHEYRNQYPDGYGYSIFCEHYRTFKATLKPSMRLIHHAGDKCFVDYSGLTVSWNNADTGEVNQVEIFVAVLGASNYTYVEATANQNLQNWIMSHVHAFDFFGGVTKSVVPDNLKSGVTKAHRYDPDTNPTYQSLAEHYNIAIIPARAYSPKDKAKVEVGVQGIQRWILAPLRHHTFFSIHEINAAIKPLLKNYNERELSGLPNETRYSQYLQIDKPALKPLPKQRYEYAWWKKAKAGIDYHIAVEKHYYSVPHKYLKHTLDVRISSKTISCYYKSKRIALHKRSYKPGHTTLKEHMPKAHQEYAKWTASRLESWAGQIGPETKILIQKVMSERKVPQQAYRACLGILRLSKHYGNSRMENAARRAVTLGCIRYKHIESILKNGFDNLPLESSNIETELSAIEHENVRGSEYYH